MIRKTDLLDTIPVLFQVIRQELDDEHSLDLANMIEGEVIWLIHQMPIHPIAGNSHTNTTEKE